MSEDLLDFDAFRRQAETIPVRVGGVVYQVPATPPAAAVLDALRLQRDGVGTIEPDRALEMATGILGVAAEQMMRSGGLSITDLMDLVMLVAERQSAAVTPPPNREARRHATRQSPSTSSSAGRSSKRTSSASTASTSPSI